MGTSAAELILAALGGGLEGASSYALKRQEIDNKQEIARLNGELKLMFEQMRSSDRQRAEDGRMTRHKNPSGNVIAQQEGQTTRNTADNETAETIAGMNDTTRRRGQDITLQLGLTRDTTARRGQDLDWMGANMRDATTRALANATDATRRRNQDLEHERGTNANALRQEELNLRRELEDQKTGTSPDGWAGSAPAEFADRPGSAGPTRRRNITLPRGPWATPTPTEVREGAVTKPIAKPVEVVEKPTETSRLPDAAIRSPEATTDQRGRLEQQARSLIEQFKAAADPAQKAALRRQLERIKADILKLSPTVRKQTKPTGHR